MGNDGFLGNPDRTDPKFRDKLDRAVWRGELGGYAKGADGPDLDRPVHTAVAAILKSAPGSGKQRALRESSQMALALRYAGSRDVDVAFVAGAQTADVLGKAGLAHLLSDRSSDDFLLSHRYLICLGGAAGAEDFLPLVNSRSVVLKEDDGWQTYMSALFQPWTHYIPLDYGAGDLDQKLAWARAHPEECARMSDNARRLCALLADREIRRRHLVQVLQDYRQADGQPA